MIFCDKSQNTRKKQDFISKVLNLLFVRFEIAVIYYNHSRDIFIYSGVPLSSTQTPSVQHIGSTQVPHPFSTQNPSVQHQKSLSSTPNPLS